MSKRLSVLGIYREERFSNRAVDADRAILDSALNEVQNILGSIADIDRIQPEIEAKKIKDKKYNLVFSMAQDEQVLSSLDHLEMQGATVVNPSRAIRNCYRQKLSELLSDEVFAYPRYVSIKIDQAYDDELFETENGYWVKRGDFHALVDDDVIYAKNKTHLPAHFESFKKRGVDSVILQENCQGELFKFYGVRDSFFNLRYMGQTTEDRYQTVQGNPEIQFNRNRLEKLVHMAARILELDYFGGDCIISDSGKIQFIDFNDWPSFRTCRNEVAPIMARYALQKVNCEVSLDEFLVSRI